ncbi:MAG: D-alanyl-D-alanine carboxypeptidase [Deltaproteobacteria bacterium]|nr:D-alanyl-D-alanine carboxypeptidase [Deltaproteobacteria bacterium]
MTNKLRLASLKNCSPRLIKANLEFPRFLKVFVIFVLSLLLCLLIACPDQSLAETRKKNTSQQKPVKSAKKQQNVKTVKRSTKAAKAAKANEENIKRLTSNEVASSCRSSILINADNGEVIFEENSAESLPPASMIKMMTVYVVMKKIESGQAHLDDKITVSPHASKIGGSQVYLKQGEQFTLEELLEAVIVQSANDAATVIAEHLAGDVSGFVTMMNEEAKLLGLKNTIIRTPHGLPPAKYQEPDLTSAKDLAAMGAALIKRFPAVIAYTSKLTSTFRNGSFTMTSSNHLLKTFPGCDGLKTGYTIQAGFGVTATAKRDGVRMIAVVMGCDNGKKRFNETARLLNIGFSHYRSVKIVQAGKSAKAVVPVKHGENAQTSLITATDLTVTTKAADTEKIVEREDTCNELEAPVKKGTSCGSITYLIGDTEIGKVSLIVPQDIPALKGYGKILRALNVK